MMVFTYQGRDSIGKFVQGSIEGQSRDSVASEIQRKGITLLKLEEASKSLDIDHLVREWMISRGEVDLDDLVIFCRQMNALTRSGIPIIRSIRGLSDSSTSELLKRSLIQIAKKLEGGVNLATCMKEHPNVFPDLFIAMVHVGENTGNLEGAFKQLAVSLELERATRKRVQQATRYPTMVIGALSLALLVINVFVIPAFSSVFERLGSDLPVPTQILIAVSNFVLTKWWLILGVLGVLGYSFIAWVSTKDGLYQWDQLKLRIPVIGPLLNLVALSRFSRNFAMMLAAGLPITQALSLVAAAVGNTYIGEAITNMRSGIERGETLVVTAGSSGMFSSLVMQMLAVGEETGQIDGLLVEVADFYDEEVEYKLSRLSDSIEPILIFVMGILVLVLALGVFLPIWSLGEASMAH